MSRAVFEPMYPVLGTRLNGNGPVVPLTLGMESCATVEEMHTNVESTLARGYMRFTEFMDSQAGECSIVGAGPSIADTYQDLRGDVIACNSAIGFLLSRGVVPKYAMLWDAHPLVETFAVPHPDIVYFVAARCHESVFERLKDCKVVVWYPGGDHDIADFLVEKNIMEPMVNGGSAAVTRSLYLAYALGYRTFHLHGADSSYRGEQTHVNGSVVPEKRLEVVCNKRWFTTTPEWAAQVEEFKCIRIGFKHLGGTIRVYGDGLLPWVASQ